MPALTNASRGGRDEHREGKEGESLAERKTPAPCGLSGSGRSTEQCQEGPGGSGSWGRALGVAGKAEEPPVLVVTEKPQGFQGESWTWSDSCSRKMALWAAWPDAGGAAMAGWKGLLRGL